MMEILENLRNFQTLYVEFPDNLHGPITSPRLFSKYCLPGLQRYCDILHGQGEKEASEATLMVN